MLASGAVQVVRYREGLRIIPRKVYCSALLVPHIRPQYCGHLDYGVISLVL